MLTCLAPYSLFHIMVYSMRKYRVDAPTSDTMPKLQTYTCQAKILILYKNNNFATIVNEWSVLKLFQLFHGDFIFSQHAYNMYKSCVQFVILIFQSQGMVSKLGHATLFRCKSIMYRSRIPRYIDKSLLFWYKDKHRPQKRKHMSSLHIKEFIR